MKPLLQEVSVKWGSLQEINSRRFTCGYCGSDVSRDKGYPLIKFVGEAGYEHKEQAGGIFICPNCKGPNFINPSDKQFPAPAIVESIKNVPEDVNNLYEEARMCTTRNCYTAATMISRKILMNVAVNKGAEEDRRFEEYVNYLDDEGYIPKAGKDWVDTIRDMGNDANHEIAEITKEDTEELLTFVSFLLRNIYDLPERASSFREGSS